MSQAKSLLLLGEKRVVLVAETEPALAAQIRLRLQQVGYEVHTVEDGLQALEALKNGAIDIALLNLSMPGMSGLEVLRLVRQKPSLQNLLVVLLAKQASSEDIAESFALGVDDFLVHPIDFTILRAKLQARLKGRTSSLTSTPDDEPVLQAGSILAGRYRLDERIGDGSFGAVFRATHIDLRREVAIKVLQTRHLPEKEALVRFRLEGIAASRLPHPNIVSIYDYGITPDGVAFMVMELLRGQPLSRQIDQKAASPERCIELILPISDALAFAHQNHLMHRDIKPENIYLHQSPFGEVPKLIDFGLAKFGATAEDINADAISTMRGHVLGTVSYMAPERFREKAYDGKVDVYGLGVTMYELLSGRPPFASRKNPLDIAKAHLYDKPPSLRERLPYISEELERLIFATLEKDPQKRPTAIEVTQRLFALQSQKSAAPYTLHSEAQQDPHKQNAHQMPTVLFQHSTFRDAPTIQLELEEEPLTLDTVYDGIEQNEDPKD